MVTDELLTKVTLDTSSTQKSSQAAEKRIQELTAALEQVQKNFKYVEATIKQTATSAAQIASVNGQLINSYQQLATGVTQTTASYVEENQSIQQLNATSQAHADLLGQQTKGYEAISASMASAGSTILTVTSVVNNLTNAFTILTDEKNLTKIANLLHIFAALASIKGHEKLADGMRQVADKITLARDALHAFREAADDDFQDAATWSERVAKGFEALKIGAIATAAGAVALSVGLNFLKKDLPDVAAGAEQAVASLGGANVVVSKFFSTLERINAVPGFIGKLEGAGAEATVFGESMVRLSKDTEQLTKLTQGGANQIRNVGEIATAVAGKFDIASSFVGNFASKIDSIPFIGFTKAGSVVSGALGKISEMLQLGADRASGMAAGANAAANAFENMGKNLPMTAQVILRLGQGVVSLGEFFRSVATDIRNWPGILAALVKSSNSLAGAFGKAIGIISTMTASLAGLGLALLHTDSTIGKIAGGGMLALAVSIGGIVTVIKALTSAMGDLISGVGAKLFTFFDAGIPAAIQDEAVTEKLTQAIQLLTGGVTQAAPVLEGWNKVLLGLAQSSALAGSEAQSLIVSVARMGQEFKLAQADQEKVVKSIAAFAKNGEDAQQMADAIRVAFLGNAKQAEALGLNLNDLALRNSDYVRSLHKGTDELTTNEKVQGRLKLLYAQAAVAQETLASGGQSLAVMQHRVTVAQGELASEFAQSSIPLYKTLAGVQLSFLNAVRSLPQGLKNAINSVTTYAGAVLIAVGEILKWSFAIGGLLGLISLFNTLVRTSAVVQWLFTAALSATNIAMKGNAIVVKTSTDVLMGFVTILRGATVLSLQAVGAALLTAARNMGTFTVSIVSNPLFWKAAIITVGVIAVVQAVRELSDELGNLNSSLGKNSVAYEEAEKAGGGFSAILDEVKGFALGAFGVLKEMAKFILVGWVGNFYLAAKAVAFVRMKLADTKEETERFRQKMDELDKKMANVSIVARNSVAKIADAFTSAASAAEDANTRINKTDLGIARFRDFVNALKNAPMDEAALRAEVLGDEFVRAGAAAQKAGMEFSRQVDKAGNMEERTREELDKTIHLREEAVKAQLGMSKVVQDAVIKLRNEEAGATAETLKSQGKIAAAAQVEADQKLKEFDRQYQAIANLRTAQDGQLGIVQRLRKALIEQGKAQVEAAKLDELKKQLEVQKKVSDRAEAGIKRTLELRGNELDQIRLRGAEEIMATHQLMEEIKASKDLTAAQKDVALASLQQTQAEEGKLILLTLQKAAADKLKEINDESLSLAREFVQVGMNEAQQMQFQLQIQADLLKEKRRQLALDAQINAGAIGALDAQLALLAAVGQERVFQIQLKETSDFGQAIAKSLRDISDTVNGSINGINAVFGTNLPRMSQTIINAIALGGAKFVSSFEGAFETTGAFIGTSITGALNYGVDGFNAVFGTGAEQFGSAITEGLSAAGKMMGSVTDTMASAIGSLFDPEFIQGIADSITQLIEQLPQLLMKAFNSLSNALLKLMDKLPQIISQLFDNLGPIIQKIMDALPKVIDKLMDAFGTFLDRLPEIVGRIVDAIPGIFAKILERLPEIITKLFNAVGTIIAQIIKVIPDILKELFDHLPDIVESIITGFLDAVGTIAAAFVDWFVSGGAEKMVGALLRAIPKLIVAIVRGIVNGLAKALGKIFGGIKVPDAIGNIPKKFEEGMKNLAAKATQEASQLFKVLDLKAEARGVNAAQKIQDAVDSAAARLGERFRGIIEGLIAAWRWIYEHIIQPLIEGITKAWQWVYENIIQPLIDGITKVWRWVYDNLIQPMINGIREVWRWVYVNLLKPAIDMTRATWEWIYTNLIQPAIEGFRAVWTWIDTNIIQPSVAATMAVWSWIDTNIIQPFVSGLSAAWTFVQTQIIDPLVGGLSRAFDWFKTNVVDSFAAGVGAVFNFFKTEIVDKFAAALQPVFTFFKTEIVDKFAGGVQAVWDWFKLNILDKFKIPDMPEWMSNFTKFKIPDMPSWMTNFSSFKIPDLPVWMRDFSKFKIPDMPSWMTSFASFKIPDMPKWMTTFAAFSIPGQPAWMKTFAFKIPDAPDWSGVGTSIVNGFSSALYGLADWLTNFFKSIISNAIPSIPGVGGGGGGGGGALAQLGHAVGLAHGGVVYAAGGMMIPRGTDTVPAMLSPGEFVMSKGAVDALGLGNMRSINRGAAPAQAITNHYDIDVDICFDGLPDETFVKAKLVPQIKRELKAATLGGELLVSKRGVF